MTLKGSSADTLNCSPVEGNGDGEDPIRLHAGGQQDHVGDAVQLQVDAHVVGGLLEGGQGGVHNTDQAVKNHALVDYCHLLPQHQNHNHIQNNSQKPDWDGEVHEPEVHSLIYIVKLLPSITNCGILSVPPTESN